MRHDDLFELALGSANPGLLCEQRLRQVMGLSPAVLLTKIATSQYFSAGGRARSAANCATLASKLVSKSPFCSSA